MIKNPSMLTKEQVESARELHYFPHCSYEIGPRGGIKEHHEVWRVGKVKTWKTRPEEFDATLQHGLKQFIHVDENTLDGLCLPEDCPAEIKKRNIESVQHDGS